MATQRPRPLPDLDSAGFWQAAAKDQLALQQCQSCSAYMFPPVGICRECGGELEYAPLSGKGEIYSFIVQHHQITGGFEDDLPYVIAVVTPVEAPQIRIPTRIVGVPPEAVQCGQQVEVRFEHPEGEDFGVPVFTPVNA